MTDEQFEYLEKYEDAFETSIKDNYIKQAIKSADVIQLRAIYSQIIGYQYKMTNTCGKCILTLMKRLGTLYFKEKNDRIESDKARQEATSTVHTEENIEGSNKNTNRKRTSKKGSDR